MSLLLVGDLVLEILSGFRVDAEERLFQQECLTAQQPLLEVDQALGIERLTVIAGLEMEVRPVLAARGAAQADHLARLDPLPGLDLAFRQVAVVSLQAVVVANDDQIAVSSPCCTPEMRTRPLNVA